MHCCRLTTRARTPKLLIAFVVVAFGSSTLRAAETEQTKISEATLAPFFAKYCVDCHGPDEQEGQVRLDNPRWDITNNDTAQRWQDLLDVMNSGDMPPDGEDQPSSKELTVVLRNLTATLQVARRRLTDHGGAIAMRRLNKREYANTIRELFGFQLRPGLIPDDGESDSFDTVGNEQFFTSSHFDKYFKLGKHVVDMGFVWSQKPHSKLKKTRVHPEKGVTDKLRKKLADDDRKIAMKAEGKTWQEMGFKDEGQATIFFKQLRNRVEVPRSYLALPRVHRAACVHSGNQAASSTRMGCRRPSTRSGQFGFVWPGHERIAASIELLEPSVTSRIFISAISRQEFG